MRDYILLNFVPNDFIGFSEEHMVAHPKKQFYEQMYINQ